MSYFWSVISKFSGRQDYFFVNQSNVRAALIWLVTNNPLYSDVNIDINGLNNLPINDVPDAVLMQTDLSDEELSSDNTEPQLDQLFLNPITLLKMILELFLVKK